MCAGKDCSGDYCCDTDCTGYGGNRICNEDSSGRRSTETDFPVDSSMACVIENCGFTYCACLKDERCLQNFAHGQRNVFGLELDRLWECVEGNCAENLPTSAETGRLSDEINKNCLYQNCLKEFLRCEVTFDCVSDSSDNPHPLRVELDVCLESRCITVSPTPVPTAAPTLSPTWDADVPASERPGLHVFFSDDDSDFETLSVGYDSYRVVSNEGRTDSSLYTFPTVIVADVVDLTSENVCNVTEQVAASLVGKAVMFKRSDSGCSSYTMLYSYGALLYFDVSDTMNWNQGYENNEILPYPPLQMQPGVWADLKSKGVTRIQFGSSPDQCNTRWAASVNLPGK